MIRSAEQALQENLQFLQAWQSRLVPVLGATVKVRQIRRVLAAI